MPAKSERFEMRLDEDILARVDGWREQEGVPSRAEAMRRLLEIGLARVPNDAVEFSDGEKLLAMMMRDVYKHLKIDGEIDPDFVGEVIWGGHYWAPKWELQGLFHEHEDAPADVSLVLDVLDMWAFLERGYQKLNKKDKERVEKEAGPFGKLVRFPGFDGNNESSHLSLAYFLVRKMHRFAEFAGRDLNSHCPLLATYKRMVSVFKPMRSVLVGAELDATLIVRILKAQVQGV